MIVNRDTAADVGSMVLKLNGTSTGALAQPTESGATVSYGATGLGPGSTNRVELSFRDTLGTQQTESWNYVISTEGVPQVESAVEVIGPYVWEPAAVVDLEAETLRLDVPVAPRFYRLRVTGGELIHEIVVAMAARLTVHQFLDLPHYHPTLAEIWTYPAEELADKIPAHWGQI